MAGRRERITVDPAILVGKPVVRGTRLAVELVLELIAHGWAFDEIVGSYPGLTLRPIFEDGERLAMAHKFEDFMKELEEETLRAGPAAVAEAEAMKAQFKLAAQLILLRRSRGLTQRQLSARTGIQQSEISRMEAGAANPTLATISALAHALGAELSLGARKPARRAPVTGQRKSRRTAAARHADARKA